MQGKETKEEIIARMKARQEAKLNRTNKYAGAYTILSCVILLSAPLLSIFGIQWLADIAVGLFVEAPSHEVVSQSATAVKVEAKGYHPKALGNLISNMVFWGFAPLYVYFAGILMQAISVWFLGYRAQWYFWTLWALTLCLMLPFIPLGTIPAIFFITHLVRKRSEYLPQKSHNKALKSVAERAGI